MARGAPDYSNARALGPLHRLDDMAELAARLGSPVIHNRSGRVVYIETFEHGVQCWHGTQYGTDGEIICSAERSRYGAYSCKLVTDSDGSYIAKIFRSFPLPTLSKYGLEFSVLLEANTETLEWRLSYHDGVDVYHYIARYRQVENDIQIKLGATSWESVVEGIDLAYEYADFHTIKSIADLENDVWVGIIVNDVGYNLSDYPAYIDDEVAGPDIVPAILIYGETGHNAFSYIDDIIITQNEP